MLLERKALSAEDLEAQTALELPNRDLMQVIVVPPGLINIDVDVRDVNVGANVCVQAIAENSQVTCEVTQR